MTDSITLIKRRIVKAIEAGEDTAELTRELAEARAKVIADSEVEALQKIALDRQVMKDRAAAVLAKVERQDKGIDQFLAARDILVSQLHPLIAPMRQLAQAAAQSWEREPGECYSGFGDMRQFAAAMSKIPGDGYLPADFGCPFLEMEGGQVPAEGRALEAYAYFMAAFGILSSFKKTTSTMQQRPASDLMALDGDEPERTCLVCDCAEVEAINAALKAGRSLRDVEAEFGVSRSSIARHKNNCLNLGVVRMSQS